MTREEMDRLIEEHITAEKAGDPAACVAMYTDDVEHDVVGAPHGPLHGTEAAQSFYDFLTANVSTEEMVPTRSSYGEDFCIVEHDWTRNDPGRVLRDPWPRATNHLPHAARMGLPRRQDQPRASLARRRRHRQAADRTCVRRHLRRGLTELVRVLHVPSLTDRPWVAARAQRPS